MPRALIVDPAFVGDVVFDGPLARALKEDGFEVGIVVRPPADAVARRMAHIDHVHVFDKRNEDRGWSGLSRTAKALAGGRYERALIPHPSVRSALLASRAKIPVRIGSSASTLAKLWLTDRIDVGAGGTFVSDRLALHRREANPSLAGVLARRTPKRTHERPRIGLALGSEWATKRWPPAQAARFVEAMARGADLVWIGAPWERALYEPFADRGEDRTGGDLHALIDAVESCDLLVGGDTGPLHIARALDIPVVALFGPTFEERHVFAEVDRILAEPLDCRPCSAHGQKRCPLGHHDCLQKLSGRRVAEAATSALQIVR